MVHLDVSPKLCLQMSPAMGGQMKLDLSLLSAPCHAFFRIKGRYRGKFQLPALLSNQHI